MNRTDATLDRLIAGNDLDELIREVDRRTDGRDWDGLVRIRDRSRLALERGFQLWPAASMAEYRLALRAPADYAAQVIAEGAGQFAIGPLTEVAAANHTWDELEPYLPHAPLTGVVAHERVVRGDDLSNATVPYDDIFELPLSLEPWEPRWALPEYRDDRVAEPRPPVPTLHAVVLPAPGEPVDDPDSHAAFIAIGAHWVGHSNGHVDVAIVDGDAAGAIVGLLDDPGSARVRMAETPAPVVLALLGWAASSGGAHGRRRGAAAGRDLTWAVANALGGVDALPELRWFVWDESDPAIGWNVRIAIEDPTECIAWSFRATDVADAVDGDAAAVGAL